MCQATTWGEKSYVMKFQLARNMQVLVHQRLSPTLLLGQSVSCILLTTSWIELSSRFPSSSHTRVRPLCVYTHTHTHTHTHTLTHSLFCQLQTLPNRNTRWHQPRWPFTGAQMPESWDKNRLYQYYSLELKSEDYTGGNNACPECF